MVTKLTPPIPTELIKLGPQVVGFFQSILDNLGGSSGSSSGVSQADFDALETRVDDLEGAGESFTSADQTITEAGPLTLAHGLSATPTKFHAFLVAQGSTEGGYAAGEVVPVNIGGVIYTTTGPLLRHMGLQVSADATNITVQYAEGDTGASPAPVFQLISRITGGGFTTGRLFDATNASWKLRIIAEP